MTNKPNFFEILINYIKGRKLFFIFLLCAIAGASFYIYRNINTITAAKMIKKADTIAAEGKLGSAIEDYNTIVRLFPGNYDAHVHLAELYLKVNEPDLAKVEYIRAIELGDFFRYEANFAIANLYVQNNEYNLAERYIKSLKNSKNKKVQELTGEFYYKWGNYLKSDNKTGAIRKLKIAYQYYKTLKNPDTDKLKKEIINTYIDISNDLLQENQPQSAIDILKLSIAFCNNASSHYKLAKIYEQQSKIDNAISEYKAAFKLNPQVANPAPYVKLLLLKAKYFIANGDVVSAELYYTWANKFNKGGNTSINNNANIVLSVLAAKSIQDIDKDVLIPQIVLKLNNVSNMPIKNTKVKVIFLENTTPFSEVVKVIATEKSPLNSNSGTSEINILSAKSVEYAFDKHNLQAQIYISQQIPDKWVLFRNTSLVIQKESVIPIIENK